MLVVELKLKLGWLSMMCDSRRGVSWSRSRTLTHARPLSQVLFSTSYCHDCRSTWYFLCHWAVTLVVSIFRKGLSQDQTSSHTRTHALIMLADAYTPVIRYPCVIYHLQVCTSYFKTTTAQVQVDLRRSSLYWLVLLSSLSLTDCALA